MMNPRRENVSNGNHFETVYYDPVSPGSFGGRNRLKRTVGRGRVKEWLESQDTYTLHKPVRYNFPRRRVIVSGIDDQWQADLVDLQSLSRFNADVRYLLTVIDVLSKFAWVRPLKNKTGSVLVQAFSSILEESGRRPRKLQTDKGSEFVCRPFQTFLKDQGICFFTTENEDTKASVVERFNRTLKSRMWRYFTRMRGRGAYLNVLQDLVAAYNRSYHRSIRTEPISVTAQNSHSVWHVLYRDSATTSKKPKFKVGDRVRISKARRKFKKGYTANWSEELFTVAAQLPGIIPRVYRLEDDSGETIKGSFYEPELQRVMDKEVYLVEKVLRTKGDKVLVRWTGYPPSFDSWIHKRDLISDVSRR